MAIVKRETMESSNKILIYQLHPSYWSQMARFALVEKGVSFECVDVDFYQGENYQPEIVRLNPACEVPFMVIGKEIICGSQNIINYVDERLMPPNSDLEGLLEKIEALRKRIVNYPITEVTHTVVNNQQILDDQHTSPKFLEIFRKRINKQQILREMIIKYPELASYYEQKLERVENQVSKMNPSTVGAFLEDLEDLLDSVERTLSENGKIWLFGSFLSNADLVLAVLMARLHLLGLSDRYWKATDRRPLLKRYYEQLQSRPSFQKECVAVMD